MFKHISFILQVSKPDTTPPSLLEVQGTRIGIHFVLLLDDIIIHLLLTYLLVEGSDLHTKSKQNGIYAMTANKSRKQ